jgi:hypothetical protein
MFTACQLSASKRKTFPAPPVIVASPNLILTAAHNEKLWALTSQQTEIMVTAELLVVK